MDKFSIAPDFQRTSLALTSLPLCEARLQNDARWPWIVPDPAPGRRPARSNT